MITSVTLKNYKAHRDTTIELGRFTVLVGPNGSGKTSVLEAIDRTEAALSRTYAPRLFPSKAGQPRVYHRNGTGPLQVAFRTSRGGSAVSVWISWTPTTGWTFGDGGADPAGPPAGGAVTFYRFEPSLIASSSESRQERPVLASDGRNAGDVIAALKLADDPVLERIETVLRSVVPSVKRILIQRREIGGDPLAVRPPGEETIVGQQIVLDFDNAPDVSAEDVSEGTLVTLALITAICSGPRPHTILLDDLGLSLHPTAQMELVRQLHRLLEETPDIQILATTHSPYILDEMKPEDVVVLAQRPDGSVASKRLSEHPDAKMRGYVTTGELWGLGNETTWVV